MKKLTIEYIREKFKERGYTLLTENYVNSKQKLEYICPNGHKNEITWSHFQQGTGCSYCSKNAKLTIEQVREAFEKEGYILLSKDYINSNTKLEYLCPNGHKHEITWSMFKSGERCPYCRNKIKHNYEEIKEAFENEGYELLSKEYINAKEKLKYKCNKNHIHEISWNDFQQGNRCPYCSDKIKLTIEQAREASEKEGYILLEEEYINSNTKMRYMCPNGHEHEITWNDFRSGYRCPFCKEYKGEKVIRLLLEELNIEYKTQYKFKDCKYKNVLKFDFYLPKYNMCIEYDGEGHYQAINWGSKGEDFAKRRLKSCQIRDGIKTQYCKDNNIILLRIPYWDFKNIENILKQELNLE